MCETEIKNKQKPSKTPQKTTRHIPGWFNRSLEDEQILYLDNNVKSVIHFLIGWAKVYALLLPLMTHYKEYSVSQGRLITLQYLKLQGAYTVACEPNLYYNGRTWTMDLTIASDCKTEHFQKTWI